MILTHSAVQNSAVNQWLGLHGKVIAVCLLPMFHCNFSTYLYLNGNNMSTDASGNDSTNVKSSKSI